MIGLQFWLWMAFSLVVVLLLALDLGFFHRTAKEISIKSSFTWSAVWILTALMFGVGVWFVMGQETALQYLTAFIMEKSLSLDNLFVFLLIFSRFEVPVAYQHRILFWGILSALVLRGIMIAFGVALINNFSWVIYLFGFILLYSAVRMLTHNNERDVKIKDIQLPFFEKYYEKLPRDNGNFLVKQAGRWKITQLMWVLFVIEITDIVFAIDSIPAVLAITQEPLIVYTSNIFAILGLRSLYFALAKSYHMFQYLKYGLSLILAFVGAKMLTSAIFHIPTIVSLSVMLTVIVASIAISILMPSKNESS